MKVSVNVNSQQSRWAAKRTPLMSFMSCQVYILRKFSIISITVKQRLLICHSTAPEPWPCLERFWSQWATCKLWGEFWTNAVVSTYRSHSAGVSVLMWVCVELRVLVQGICSYLGGNATAEETEVAKKNLDHIDQELGTSGHGLLDDQEIHRLEDDLAVVYYQLGIAVRKLSLNPSHAGEEN